MNKSEFNLVDIERKTIIAALSAYKRSKKEAASALGISVSTLYNRMHQFEIFEDYRVIEADSTFFTNKIKVLKA